MHERNYIRHTAAEANLSQQSAEDGKQIMMHFEIHIELTSLTLRQIVDKKKKKQELIRMKNAELLKKIYSIDNVWQSITD